MGNSSGHTSPEPTLQTSQSSEAPQFAPKGSAFWLSFLAIIVSIFLSALDLTAVATVLPTVTDDLNGGDDFVWVGSAYALSSTAILPLTGGLADIFGRKPLMLISIVFFCIGSALAGAAQNMDMMIAARTVQGLGGGGIMNMTNIIVSDLVPLAERGLYQGLLGLTWSLASGIGPPIGGALAERASWRWLFYLNLPLTGIAFGLVLIFLQVRTPEGSMGEKLARVDWFGNLIIIAGTTLSILGLTWGGVRYPWSSAHVLAPLVIGLSLVAAFIVYEATIPQSPTIPFKVLTNRTTIGGYISTMTHGITSISIIYYIPVYFQACKGASPIRSGVDMLATALVIAPFALICGIIIKVSNKYRPANAMGWILTIIGFGLLSLLKADSPVKTWVGYQFLVSAGTGMIFAGTIFPVLAPLPVHLTAPALAFLAFLRTFAQTWGITIASTVLQNELKRNLPAEFVSTFPQGLEIVYAAIPHIEGLSEPLRTEVRVAFATSMSVIWKTMVGISGLGIISLFLLKEIPMRVHTDDNFGLSKDPSSKSLEEPEKTQVQVNQV
ncbi:hypothetical protein NLI96_g7790 [Meripilus lineatus]|uniref:Major facilitator superfamily (MFS) profile domain-containing protein n=1 Tax=Meripilus lineatus TaxID=2056292 RepID=A0AAD5UYJ1_9APHY|nr:hypothetical protein NLI96_g7790 [Physisporinus lineatus]